MKLFDYVRSSQFVLASGSCRYDRAIVMQIEPLVLISVEGDMMWTATIQDVEWEVIGHATDFERIKAVKRFAREIKARCKHEWIYDWTGMTLSRECANCRMTESRIINPKRYTQTVMAELWPGEK